MKSLGGTWIGFAFQLLLRYPHNGDATCCDERAEGECTGGRRQGDSGDVLGEKREGDGDGGERGKLMGVTETCTSETRREVTELTETREIEGRLHGKDGVKEDAHTHRGSGGQWG